MAAKSISVNSLLLDLENPRITTAHSQREALQRIIADQDVRLAVLAESIVAQGGLNPMDRLLILKEPGTNKFIVYEGNRRFAAIKILHNPSVLSNLEIRPALKKRFEAAAKKFDPSSLSKVDCYEIKSRQDGAKWLHQRHTGENKGSGIVSWSGVATARFRGNDPALQALDLILKHGGLSADEKDDVEDSFPITNLDRLLSTPDVRSLIGFEIHNSKLQTELPPPAAVKILKRIILDLSSGSINVTKIKTKTQQVAYIKTLGSDLPDLAKKSGQLVAVAEWDDQTFGAAATPTTSGSGSSKPTSKAGAGTAKKSSTKKRTTLIEDGCVLNVTVPKIAEIENELRKLKLSDHKHAISVLFRVFLEISVDIYLQSKGIALTVIDKGGHKKDKGLAAKVAEAITEMVNAGVPPKRLDGVSKGINDSKNPIYINTLHNYVHNAFFTPTESDLTAAFDNSRPFFEEIWK